MRHYAPDASFKHISNNFRLETGNILLPVSVSACVEGTENDIVELLLLLHFHEGSEHHVELGFCGKRLHPLSCCP